MFTGIIKSSFDYTCKIADKLTYEFNVVSEFFYNVVIDGIKAFKGRLKYYDDIKIGQLDALDLGYLDELEE